MSYSIIFKSYVVEHNGKIYHFLRQGCNNDDSGRRDDEFSVDVYNNKEQALKDIERFKGNTEDTLKINSKYTTYDNYYNYLKKKIEKPMSFVQFRQDYFYSFKSIDGIYCWDNQTIYSVDEYNKNWRDLYNKYGTLTKKYLFKDITIDELTSNMKNVIIYIKNYSRRFKKYLKGA